ncbi:MAG TPA: hypothetical protein VFT22_06045 [Kofleriaceae bacterium]|nr:hypothetical protein [Kofleriaceae bacterium]
MRDVVLAPKGLEALELVMRYILLVNDQTGIQPLQAFLERAAGPEAKDTVMTVGQRLIDQGFQEGIQQGRQEGIQQGRQDAERAVLLRLLRFGAQVDGDLERRLAVASSEQIAAWTERVLTAATLSELLAS